ncbi:MAG: FAD-dependent monooxygenase [Alphaproteobacteria bacterium]
MKVVVAGGGIGGLTTALALHAAGIEAEVCEAVAATEPRARITCCRMRCGN